MSAATADARRRTAAPTVLDEPHHDGSDLYVVERPTEAGGRATLRLRAPRGTGVDTVVLRYVEDGEPRASVAELDAETETESWWRASVTVQARTTHYRWLLSGGEIGYGWINGLGLVDHDVPDADDFVLPLDTGGPDWHLGSVVYQIFVDRFARGGVDADPPGWAIPRGWDDAPTGRGPDTPHEWFGGDLAGVEQHLDHVESLGANVLYLTPIFPAGSTHRYDATSLEHVDALLGGDRALDSLVRAAHDRGLRVVCDLTTNHVGDRHPWFEAARGSPAARERSLFYFDGDRYESWYGVPSLPKLNWGEPELESRMLDVVRGLLGHDLDGLRIDVANMTGRRGDVDVNGAVARAIREAVGDALLVAEHGHDFRPDLLGDGWHGAMNYAGFLRPVWTWLRRDDLPDELRRGFWGVPVGLPRLGGPQTVATMRAFRAGVPWQSVLHSWVLLDSHDVARFRTVSGSRARHAVGIGLQMTTPGVPMVFAGDELGLEGDWGEDARRTMPWDRPESWDRELLDEYRRLIALRRSSDALARGGIRYAHVTDDAIAYLRETHDERLLCIATREAASLRIPLHALGAASAEALHGDEPTHDGGALSLSAPGPSFHVWRLIDG
jgi:alpha-glucosidase